MRHHILQMGPLLPETEAALQNLYEVYRLDMAADKEAFLAGINANIEVIATRGDYLLGEEVFCHLPHLKLISSSGAGYDGIDVPAAKSRGVIVTNTPGIVSECVADMTFGLLIATVRQIVKNDRFARSGTWLHQKPTLTDKVWGENLGIIGLGGIGKAIARRATGFGMSVGYHGRNPQRGVGYRYFRTAQELAEWARFLIVAVPGGAGTVGIVSREVLMALGPSGYLVNVARGTVVDEPALIEALQTGTIAGAGLDVFADEPHIPKALLELDQVVLQPHLGSGSNWTRVAMGQRVLDNIAAHFAKEPLHSPIL